MRKEPSILGQFALYFVMFIGLSMAFTQIIPFLINIGYTPQERGYLLSGMAVVTILGQLWSGYLCDRYRTVKRFFNLFLILYVFVTAIMYAYTGMNFFFHLLIVSFMGGLFRIVNGLMETRTIETSEYARTNFGMIRAFGAIGWAIGAPLTSFLVGQYGYIAIGFGFAIATSFSLLISSRLPDADKVATKEKIRFVDIKQLFEHKPYVMLLIILLIVNIALMADMYTVIDKILIVGGTNDTVALKWSFQAITELPLFFLGAFFLNKFGAKKVLVFAIWMYLFRYLLYATVQTPMLLVAVSGLQAFTFPFLMISSKVLVNDESPAHLKSSGQMFAMSVAGGLSMLITPILSGFLVTNFGYDATMYGIAAALMIPLILSLYYKKMSSAI